MERMPEKKAIASPTEMLLPTDFRAVPVQRCPKCQNWVEVGQHCPCTPRFG